MNDVEESLRRALRPIEPPEGFAERVLRALPERRVPSAVVPLNVVPLRTRSAPPVSAWRRFSMPAAMAASLLVAVFAGLHVANQGAERERQAGLAASRELMQALRVTSQKLDLAYEAVQRPAPATTVEEENRS